ncbi:MAG: SIMPL domain-containing protein [Hyphomicrobiaceae bacterium]
MLHTHLVLALFLVSLVMPTALAHADKSPRTITIHASGSVAAEPDQALISTGVSTQGRTAADALTANSKLMANVIDGLKALGIAPQDMQTADFSINERYTSAPGQEARVTGYEVRNSLSVRVRNLAQLGEVLDKATALGANQFGGLTFLVSEAETLTDAARKAAVTNARRRAETLAQAAGVALGDIISITEGGAAMPRPMPMARGMIEAAQSVPIEAGQNELRTSVEIVWKID